MRLLYVCYLAALAGSLSAQTLEFADYVQINRSSAEVGVADVDGDGNNDILISGATQRWYRGPDFTQFYVIGESDGGPYAARVADMNADGYPDFVTSDGARQTGDYPGHVYLYLHPGAGGDVTQPWQRIVVYSGDVRHQNDMRLVDIDGDGRLDILEKTWSSTERVLMAFQNPDINSWTVRTFVTGETGLPEGISAGDLDGDGDTEIVQSGVYWDCPGNWRTDAYAQYPIDLAFYASVYDKTKSEVGDIDGDGDNDVYIGSAEGSDLKLAWYENTGLNGDGSVAWTEHLIRDNFGKCHTVELEDIDQDGDLDLCTGRSFGQNGVLIFYNNGDGSAWTEQNIDPDGNLYTGQVADLDADGDLDYVGPWGFNRQVRYYLNLTPAGPRAGAVTASPPGGTYVDPPTVTLTSADPPGTIYFTTDGTEPTDQSLVYSAPLTFTTNTRLRAVALGPGLLPSALVDEFYVVAENGNFPPVADAGPDRAQGNFDPVTLDGSGSSDADDAIASLGFQWSQLAGPGVSLSAATSAVTQFTPTATGTYRFELAVSDEAVTDRDTIVITISDLDDALIAYWPFDESAGEVATELVAARNAQLDNGAVFGDGQIGNALLLDGTDDRAEAPSLDPPGSTMTIAAWILPTDLANVEGRIVSKASGTNGNDHYWMLSQNGGSALRFRLKAGGGTTTTLISPVGVLTAEQWTFVAAVYDGSEMRVYRDGELVASTPQTGSITAAPTVGVGIGDQPAGAGDRPFRGAIDELRIYDRALTQAELVGLQADGGALPVTWRYFRGAARAKEIDLEWGTLREENNRLFAVERLGPGGFAPLGTVPAGDGTYAFTDRQPLPGANLYRLRQVDADGAFTFSETITVDLPDQLRAYPSPAREHFLLEGAAAGRFTVYDAYGNTVLSGQHNGARTQVRCEGWAAGVYLVRVEEGRTVRVVVK